MKKQLFIHIGLFKTGTTTLQNTLSKNYDALLEQGIIYPKSVARNSQHAVFVSYFSDLPRKCVAHKKRRCQRCWSDFIQEVSDSRVKKIVLSSEYFSTMEEVAKLAEYCRAFDTKIILYLRRQDQFLQALYNQQIKSSFRQLTLGVSEFLDKNRCRGDFKALIDRWAHYFGPENMLIRAYEKAQLPDGLVHDFMSLIRCDYRNFISSGKTNPSLPSHYVAVVRAINRGHLSFNEHKRFITVITDAYSSGSKAITTHTLFSPQQCLNIMQQFLTDNKEIARRYLNRKNDILFEESLPDITMLWEESKLLVPEELIQKILIPYMTLNGKKPLTSECVIKELLIPYIKSQSIHNQPVAIHLDEQTISKQKLSNIKKLQQRIKAYDIKKVLVRARQRVKRIINF